MRKTNRFSLSLSVLSTVLRFGRELHCHECSMVCGVRYICIAQLLLYIYIRVAKTDIFVWTTSVLCPCLAFSVPIFTLRLCLFLSLTHSRSLPISLSLFLSLSPWLSVSLSLWVQRSSNVPNTRTKKRTQLYANVWVRQMPAIKSFKYFPLHGYTAKNAMDICCYRVSELLCYLQLDTAPFIAFYPIHVF